MPFSEGAYYDHDHYVPRGTPRARLAPCQHIMVDRRPRTQDFSPDGALVPFPTYPCDEPRGSLLHKPITQPMPRTSLRPR